MQYDFLKDFTRRMKCVGLYALLYDNSSQKYIWKERGFNTLDEQLNVIFSVMLYIMEQSLKEELKNVNDLDYIEEQARIQLRMIKPGEILYITDDDLKENKQEGNGDGQQSDKEED